MLGIERWLDCDDCDLRVDAKRAEAAEIEFGLKLESGECGPIYDGLEGAKEWLDSKGVVGIVCRHLGKWYKYEGSLD